MRRALPLKSDRLRNLRVKIAHGSLSKTKESGEHSERPDLAFSICFGDVNHAADDLDCRYNVDEQLTHSALALPGKRESCARNLCWSRRSSADSKCWGKDTLSNAALTL